MSEWGAASKAGFRRKKTPDDAKDHGGLVARAVARAKQGDRDAVRYLYMRYSDNVYGYVRSIVRDEYEAEDVTQDVFIKLMRVITSYEQRAVPFSAWILRVARNVAVDHMRRNRMVPCETIRGVDDRFDETSHERSRCLKEALESVSDEQRQVVVLRHMLGLSPGEIANCLAKSEDSIHGLHHRGRRAVQEALVDLESAPAIAVAS